MKRRFEHIVIILLLCTGFSLAAQQPIPLSLDGTDFSCSAYPHPRLLVDDAGFKQVRKAVNSCRSKPLLMMHQTYMELADECVRKDVPIEYVTNSSGKLLEVSRKALTEIGACAYAYRFTKDPKYAERVESVLNDVCDFSTWHPEHYLDVAEMTLAVALGYDWCYAKLSKKTKEKCENAVKSYSFDTAETEPWRKKFRNGTNWGQVLNAGLICSAIAFYEKDPERSNALIERAVRDNGDYIAYNYAPDGVNPEGPGYWGYGTSMQVIINAALEHSYGTDFGLSLCPGFEKSALFITFATGPSGEVFNFSDGSIKKSQPALWYFADKYSNPGLAYNEVKLIESMLDYKMRLRFGFSYILFASKVLNVSDAAPENFLYVGQGKNPVMMARSGWTKEDLYVGAKGGGARNNHAHLDAGSFVYDAYGKRWLCEPKAPKYVDTEAALRTIEASVWTMKQESMRWKIYGYNNAQHNTITINGADHLVTGHGSLDEVWDESSKRGARFGLTSLFDGQADSVSRSVSLVDNDHLEIVDYIRALPDKAAEVYCNFTTKAAVNVSVDGIVLTIDKVQMRIVATGAEVEYTSGMIRPDGVPECLDPFYQKVRDKFVGIKYTVQPGDSVCVTIKIKRI